MRNQDENYYDILSVAKTATQEEIKKAWRKKAFEFHPDRGGSDKMMFKINWAYEQLSNPESRRNYDRSNTYQQQTNKERPHQQQKTNNTHAKKEPREEAPENYDNAVFVDGIGSKDKSGSTTYVKRGDYVYYPAQFNNKFLFWQRKDIEYYRAVVTKVYSRKQNNFRVTPLFVVEVEGFQQIIFLNDYAKHWYSQKTFTYRERVKAIKALVIWAVSISILIYLIAQ